MVEFWHIRSSPGDRIRPVPTQRWMAMPSLAVCRRVRRVCNCGTGALLLERPLKGGSCPGQALRILTGAALPDGADTVVLQEDVRIEAGRLQVTGPLKAGANARAAGEDMQQGAQIFPAGHQLRPEDLGVIAAAGLGEVSVFRPLKVAVISTGTELRAPGQAARVDQIFDANRPMLCAVLRRWGMEVVDLGIVPDEAAAVRAALDRAKDCADVIMTSGGASAGDEDHMSAVLRASGGMALWRIAVKPGRPLALGVWGGVPVFGLPGNPVAAFVCTLIFARPALLQLAGAGFQVPQAVHMPAAFSKTKKSWASRISAGTLARWRGPCLRV